MFGLQRKRNAEPARSIDIRERTRTRVATLSGPDIDNQLEVMLNRSLPEIYTLWRTGQAPAEEVGLVIEAVLACWDELVARSSPDLLR